MEKDRRQSPLQSPLQSPQSSLSRRTASTGRRHSSSRELVLRTIEAQQAPVSLSALVRSTGLHENTVRGHLGHLLEDGHVTRRRARAEGRGRPAWLWRAVRQGPSSPYAELAGVLADALAHAAPDPSATARAAGRRWGQEIARDSAACEARDDPAGPDARAQRDIVLAVMAEQGFYPEGRGQEISLRRCPLLEAASRQTQVVCAVHRGMVEGVLEHLGSEPGGSVDLQPFAGSGRCSLHMRSSV